MPQSQIAERIAQSNLALAKEATALRTEREHQVRELAKHILALRGDLHLWPIAQKYLAEDLRGREFYPVPPYHGRDIYGPKWNTYEMDNEVLHFPDRTKTKKSHPHECLGYYTLSIASDGELVFLIADEPVFRMVGGKLKYTGKPFTKVIPWFDTETANIGTPSWTDYPYSHGAKDVHAAFVQRIEVLERRLECEQEQQSEERRSLDAAAALIRRVGGHIAGLREDGADSSSASVHAATERAKDDVYQIVGTALGPLVSGTAVERLVDRILATIEQRAEG